MDIFNEEKIRKRAEDRILVRFLLLFFVIFCYLKKIYIICSLVCGFLVCFLFWFFCCSKQTSLKRTLFNKTKQYNMKFSIKYLSQV